MILLFPDLDTLRLALTSGAVPAAVSQAQVAAGFDGQGQVWLQPSVAVPRAALAALRRLKVQVPRSSPVPLTERCQCWPQLLPLDCIDDRLPPEQTPVLFDLPADQLAAVVTEVLRLGNDRQSFRYLQGPDGSERVLLRVVGPPYYSLLRALDRDTLDAGPVAYIECAPRLWIEVGHTHPLAGLIKVPDGKVLLLRPRRLWTVLDDVLFRDIYEVLEFTLPAARSEWQDHALGRRLRVPLRLVPGDLAEVDELWVLRARAVEQLDEFVSNADDDLLRQLSFAVAEKDGQTVIAVRVRPTKAAPPELVLQGVAFRSYQKLPNLFVPSGRRLHPPLSRHVLRTLLADDPDVITWLYPDGDGGFTPETLPDEAFRPLGDWTDYVLDRDRQALTAWVQAARFDFEPFVCADDGQPARPKKPAGAQRQDREEAAELVRVADVPSTAAPAEPEAQAEPVEEFTALAVAEPGALEQQLAALEQHFLNLDGPLDSDERRALWPKLAALNAGLGRSEDAALCWIHALWLTEAPPRTWLGNWLQAEASTVPVRQEGGGPKERSWAVRPALAVNTGREPPGEDLDQLLGLPEPATGDLRALTAFLFWAASQKPTPSTVIERLGRIQHFLESHDARPMPARALWLGWLALVDLAHGDVLALARARDRLLERLFHNGLRPDQDLPSFLRIIGQSGSRRFHAVQHWLRSLCDRAHSWLQRVGRPETLTDKVPRTEAYVDLMFAFGLARLGDVEGSRALVRRAQGVLGAEDEAHRFMLEAYGYRIRQALEGKPNSGPLPADQMEYLALLAQQHREQQKLNPNQREVGPDYIIDRLRSLSRILEPDQKIAPYRRYEARRNSLEYALGELPDIIDRAEVAVRIRGLLRDRSGTEAELKILRAGLDQAPRVGEPFALDLLDLLPAALDALAKPRDLAEFRGHANLLGRGLFVAAHFGSAAHVQLLTARFGALLQSLRGTETAQALDSVAAECFRGLRRLGMRAEIDQLLAQTADLLLQGKRVGDLDAAQLGGSLPVMRALLHLAAGWYDFGRDQDAEAVVGFARSFLFGPTFAQIQSGKSSLSTPAIHERTELLRAYTTAVSLGPVEPGQQRLEELFDRLEGLPDRFESNAYYSRFQLEVVEAVILAAASEESAMGPEARRWLDNDEFLVRRRIHRDVRALVGSES
jgi:hypothetical protein